jgi:hypothetical protein
VGDPASFTNDDSVKLFAGSFYVQATTHWISAFRTVLELCEDYQHGTDIDHLTALRRRLHQWRHEIAIVAAAQGEPHLRAERRAGALSLGQ